LINYDWERLFKVAYAPYGYPQSLRQTIMTKKGVCHDAAYAACSCLERGGYDVTPLSVIYSNRTAFGAGGHWVCLIKARDSIGNREYLVIGDTNRKGQIGGPFKSIEAAAEYAAKGIGIRDYFIGRFGW
jgi:hypothetical protein